MSDIRIEKLNVSYDTANGKKVIFDNFDIAFESEKINVILGGSGVGKTTLLNVIAGIIDGGSSVQGVDGEVSYIFQNDRLIPTISVYKNLDLILRSVFKDKNERRKRIEKFAKIAEIEDVLNSLPTNISGGQAQRVAMARAFAYPSKVLLLDEPFKALDTALKARLIGELIKLNEVEPRTIVFVTHAIDECLLCADNYFVFAGSPVSVIANGQIDKTQQERKLNDGCLDSARAQLLDALTSTLF